MTVYFARAQETGLIKIGFVGVDGGSPRAVARRMGQLTSTFGVTVSLIASMPGDRELERWLHRRHEGSATGYEWFRRSPLLQADIDQVKAGVALEGMPGVLSPATVGLSSPEWDIAMWPLVRWAIQRGKELDAGVVPLARATSGLRELIVEIEEAITRVQP